MIELYVTGQSLKCTTPVIAADSLRYLTVRAAFDSAWDGYTKWLHLRRGSGNTATTYDIQLVDDSVRESDCLNLTAGEWVVYLTGNRETHRLTTVPVIVTVRESGLIDAPLHEIPASVAEQLGYKVELALRQIDAILYRPGLVISGFKDTPAQLEQDVPNPCAGEAYAVGTAPPFLVYIWDGQARRWRNAGALLQTVAQGAPGTTFTPTVDEAGNISWVNDGSLPNPETRNIMGPRGQAGAQGPAGKSAYDSAAEAGYTGEEEVFNDALATLPVHAGRHLPSGADPITVATGNLEDAAVTAQKLANGSVTAGKLGAGAVTAAAIAGGAVNESKLAAAGVTAGKIASGAVSAVYTATLPAAGWMGSEAPYTQDVSVNGMLGTDMPIVDLMFSGSYAADAAAEAAWTKVYRVAASDGRLTFYAHEKPDTALSVKARCIRK